MSRAIIGIDPGAKGFASLFEDGRYICSVSVEDEGVGGLKKFLVECKYANYESLHVVIEDPGHIVGSVSSVTNFKFGYNVGICVGLLVALEIPYTQVPPQRWQRSIWTSKDYVCKPMKEGDKRAKRDTKATSILAAKRLFPGVDLRRNERCKSIDDNKVDSMLIAEYGRRNNL